LSDPHLYRFQRKIFT